MNNSKIIYYLATKKMVVKTLEQLYQSEGYTFVELEVANGLPEDFSVLLLIEPLNLDSDYYAVNQLWKNYLYRHRPNTKLVVATYAQSLHQNLFSLLNFPKKLEDFLAKAKPVAAYSYVHTGVETNEHGEERDAYMDSWIVKLPHSGRPATLEMKQFLDGHDRSRSFSGQLFILRKLMSDFFDPTIQEKPSKASIDELKTELNHLLQRWYYYQKLFDFFPYADTMQRILKDLQTIKKQMEEQQVPTEDARDKLTQIYDLTQNVINPIVFPLDYW